LNGEEKGRERNETTLRVVASGNIRDGSLFRENSAGKLGAVTEVRYLCT